MLSGMNQGNCCSAGGFSEAAGRSDPRPCPVEEFPSVLARRTAYSAPHYVLFTADPESATGRPWCPDCDRALDAARQRVEEVGGTLLEIEVTSLQSPAECLVAC